MEAQELRAVVAFSAFIAPAIVGAATPDMTGHYYMSGVREVGSELMLRPDGSYEWFLAYGALDQYSVGQWRKSGNEIVLTADAKALAALAPGAISPFLTLQLRVDGEDLIIPDKPGRYSRH